jgi:hypothetical protein
MGVLCICLKYKVNGQSSDGPQAPASIDKFHHITVSVETEFPVQHLARLAYAIGSPKKPFGISLFIHGGLPAYLDQSIDFVVDKKEKANAYLKNNLQPLPCFGAGVEFFYRHWSLEFLYQNTSYKINKKNARELVENLLPNSESYIAQEMNTFSKIFPVFGDVYNNYKLTSQFRLNQISSHIGYKFLFWKNSRLGGEFKLGVLTIFESSLETKTDQSNEAADYLVGLVNSSLDEELRQNIQWLIVPTASAGVFIKL